MVEGTRINVCFGESRATISWEGGFIGAKTEKGARHTGFDDGDIKELSPESAARLHENGMLRRDAFPSGLRMGKTGYYKAVGFNMNKEGRGQSLPAGILYREGDDVENLNGVPL